MKFPCVFKRWKGAGNTGSLALLGSDAVPVASATANARPSGQDNIVNSRFTSINGWPCYRIAVLYKPPSGTLALHGNMHMYEDNMDTWFRVNGVAGVSNILAGAVTFFDCVALLDKPHSGVSLGEDLLGSISQMLVVTDPGAAPDGLHTFAMAADLTTF